MTPTLGKTLTKPLPPVARDSEVYSLGVPTLSDDTLSMAVLSAPLIESRAVLQHRVEVGCEGKQ